MGLNPDGDPAPAPSTEAGESKGKQQPLTDKDFTVKEAIRTSAFWFMLVAMWAAVERYVKLDHDAERREWERRIQVITDAVKGIPTVRTRKIVPPIANRVPHVLLLWDEKRVRLTPVRMKQKLAGGEPSIATARVHGTGKDGFLISVFMLQPGEDCIVGKRVREILDEASK